MIEHAPAAAPELERVKVLLVDDRTDDLNILRMTLDSPGYDLVTARSGSEALKKVLVDEFAVIVCDVLLPVMDGFEVAALIKQREKSKHTPILFLTAAGADMRFIYRAYAVGAVDFMTKPLEPDVLRAKVAIFADMFRKDLRIRRQAEALRVAGERQKELELAELRRRTDERYRNLADASPSIVWTAGPGGEIGYANRRWREYTGMSHDDWRSWGWLRAIHEDDVERFETGWREAIVQRSEYTAECRVRRAVDGAFRWHLCYAMPEADASGHLVGWVATMTDTEELRQSIQARDEFLAVASHELRTPLSTLGLAVHGLRLALNGGSPDPARMAAKVEAAERQVQRLDKLVSALLDVTRIVGRRVMLEPNDCDLAQLAREVVERARSEADKAGCELNFEAPAPVLGRWDALRLDQVLTNLLSNALRHGAGRPVEIAVAVEAEAARLVVRDHGEGISRDQIPLLFGRFQRGSGRTGQGGLGLGLFISRHIVEAHGGAITVASEPGLGTTFTVELPTAGSDEEQEPQ